MMFEFVTNKMVDEDCEIVTIMEKHRQGMIRVCSYNNDNVCIVSDLSVSESFRRKGLGNQLMKEAVLYSSATERDFVELKVKRGSWTEDWYKRIGFRLFSSDGDFDWLLKNLKEMEADNKEKESSEGDFRPIFLNENLDTFVVFGGKIGVGINEFEDGDTKKKYTSLELRVLKDKQKIGEEGIQKVLLHPQVHLLFNDKRSIDVLIEVLSQIKSRI